MWYLIKYGITIKSNAYDINLENPVNSVNPDSDNRVRRTHPTLAIFLNLTM
jgi:hypothetical protein